MERLVTLSDVSELQRFYVYTFKIGRNAAKTYFFQVIMLIPLASSYIYLYICIYNKCKVPG